MVEVPAAALTDDATTREAGDGAVAAYKIVLREVINRRPSGTRRRLAMALGKHRSFVTQITNPAYPVPIPTQHLKVIFEVCHFAPAEREAFLEAFSRAHPGRGGAAEPGTRGLVVTVPDLGDRARNRAFDALVLDLVARLARHAEESE